MKSIKVLGLVIFTLFIYSIAFAIDVAPAPVGTTDFFSSLLSSFASFKGAGTLAIIQLVSQLLMKFIGTPIFDAIKLDPKYKFLIFAILNLVLNISGLMVGPTALSFGQAILSGGAMLLISQYGFRIYELFVEKKDISTLP